MILYNNEIPDNNSGAVYIENFTVTYTQDLNSCQSESDFNDDYQRLTLTTDDAGGGKFIHMTLGDAGWSLDVNEIEDFIEILRHFKNVIEVGPK